MHLLEVVERAGGETELQRGAQRHCSDRGDETHPHEAILGGLVIEERLSQCRHLFLSQSINPVPTRCFYSSRNIKESFPGALQSKGGTEREGKRGSTSRVETSSQKAQPGKRAA